MAEGDINFKTTTDLVAYYEADTCMKVSVTAAQHMASMGATELAAFFTVGATMYQEFIQALIRKNSTKIEIAHKMPDAKKGPG